jgi:hypothetical protein
MLDGYSRAARVAHEYASRLHRKLVELGGDDDHTRALLRESAALTVEPIPVLVRQVRSREREWEEQDMLDPPAAERTIERLDREVAELAPELAKLRERQREILAELRDLLDRAR